MTVEKTLRRLLSDPNLLGSYAHSQDADDNLFDLIDSMQMLRIVSNVEKTFRIEIEDFEMIPTNLQSINALIGLLERKLGPPARVSA
jgi:acyl carrier protein